MKKNRTEEREEIDEYGDMEPYQVDKLSKIPSGLIITFIPFINCIPFIYLGLRYSDENFKIE